MRISAEVLAAQMHRLAPMLTGGGVTISGGELLMQPAFLLALLKALEPLHTIVETSGYASPDTFQRVAAACDTVYLDIKHADDDRHRELTGVGNGPILANLRWLMEREKPFLVRIPLIPGCNDDAENLMATAELLTDSGGLTAVELLPLNPFSAVKYKLLGEEFPLDRMEAAKGTRPSAADPTEIFTVRGIPCKLL